VGGQIGHGLSEDLLGENFEPPDAKTTDLPGKLLDVLDLFAGSLRQPVAVAIVTAGSMAIAIASDCGSRCGSAGRRGLALAWWDWPRTVCSGGDRLADRRVVMPGQFAVDRLSTRRKRTADLVLKAIRVSFGGSLGEFEFDLAITERLQLL